MNTVPMLCGALVLVVACAIVGAAIGHAGLGQPMLRWAAFSAVVVLLAKGISALAHRGGFAMTSVAAGMRSLIIVGGIVGILALASRKRRETVQQMRARFHRLLSLPRGFGTSEW